MKNRGVGVPRFSRKQIAITKIIWPGKSMRRRTLAMLALWMLLVPPHEEYPPQIAEQGRMQMASSSGGKIPKRLFVALFK